MKPNIIDERGKVIRRVAIIMDVYLVITNYKVIGDFLHSGLSVYLGSRYQTETI